MYRVADTKTARAIIAESQRFNRRIPVEWSDRLDPDGLHVFDYIMDYPAIDGWETEPHKRCFAYFKVKGSKDPLQCVTDMSTVTWDAMPVLPVDN
jgi:hypothetical protein